MTKQRLFCSHLTFFCDSFFMAKTFWCPRNFVGVFFFFFFFFLQASKIFIAGKQIAPRAAGRGEKSPAPIVLWGFLSFNDVGGTNWVSFKDVGGPKRCFLLLALLDYIYQSLSNRGVRGRNVPFNFLWFLCPFLLLSHRGLGINDHLGIGTFPIENKACGDVTLWSP